MRYMALLGAVISLTALWRWKVHRKDEEGLPGWWKPGRQEADTERVVRMRDSGAI